MANAKTNAVRAKTYNIPKEIKIKMVDNKLSYSLVGIDKEEAIKILQTIVKQLN